MYLIQDNEIQEHDYVTYARQFDSYRWFKPVLTMFFTVLFFAFLGLSFMAAAGAADFMLTGGDWQAFRDRFTGGYDTMEVTDPIGALVGLGTVALLIPSFWFARGIVRERPFSSYTSSRGGWGWWIFIKCLVIALVVCALPLFIYHYYFEEHGPVQNHFVNYGLYFLIVLCPLQCIAEEYIFRGLINQALGAWFRIPIIAIVLSAVGFAALHPYNNIGKISVLVSGVCFGIASWMGRGLEVSSALHIVNNMMAFLMDGFGISNVQSEVGLRSSIVGMCAMAVYTGIIIFLSKKTDWFDRAKFDDAMSHNAELEAKRNNKAARKAAKIAKKEARAEAKEAAKTAKAEAKEAAKAAKAEAKEAAKTAKSEAGEAAESDKE